MDPTVTAPPAKCQGCGYSSRHTKQKPGETPEFVACCQRWFCAVCRDEKGCTGDSDHAVIATARSGYPNGVPPNDGLYSRIPENVYHGDHTSLSSSGARTIFNTTPEQFLDERNEPRNPKPIYDFGHAAHKMVLGEGAQLVCVDHADWRTNDAKAKRAKAYEEGKAPLLKKDIDLAQRMAGKVFQHKWASKLLARGNAEMSGYWHDDETRVRLRFRPDWIPELPSGRSMLVDYKTAKSAHPEKFKRHAGDFGYHCQAAWYLDGFAEVQGVDDAAFVFIVQEKTSPFSVSVVQLEPEDIERGRQQNRVAIDTYARCVESGEWPGYDELYTVGLPHYLRTQIDDQLEIHAREEIQ
ncbi:PD-(D/E)XK nuclease superfamily protein [Mycolicibacterium fluoranthenivorans]|uniref:PD-(D/E)XK nuclease superfamily protein n=1 Tax=Mycolicibacterium fluoranthenivorans TaxID=258505 RepID=A0A1G4X2S6_9MYCO|nr:PD-(D/E)XK nuclease superfamily protein [Mycolicibacterium fluoranthenivorans]